MGGDANYYLAAAAAVKKDVKEGKEPNSNTLFDVRAGANTLHNIFCDNCKEAIEEYTRFKNRQ